MSWTQAQVARVRNAFNTVSTSEGSDRIEASKIGELFLVLGHIVSETEINSILNSVKLSQPGKVFL